MGAGDTGGVDGTLEAWLSSEADAGRGRACADFARADFLTTSTTGGESGTTGAGVTNAGVFPASRALSVTGTLAVGGILVVATGAGPGGGPGGRPGSAAFRFAPIRKDVAPMPSVMARTSGIQTFLGRWGVPT
jgi:hypothetical protein